MASPAIELFLRQAGRGVSRINARTAGISGALQPFGARAQGYFDQAAGQEQALGGALQGALAGAGEQQGSAITGALQGIQAPAQAVQQFGGGQTTIGQQSGAAAGALSSADVQRLHGQGTAEQIYASALPRLAQLAGEQERRGFLADAQQELADLSLRQAEQNSENAKYERDWQYKVRQDKIEQQRYQRETRYEAKQDRLKRLRDAKMDRVAISAARQEYGLDVYNTQTDNQRSAASAAETARHHRETEAAAKAREARQRAKDAKSGAKTGDGDKAFYDSREDAFKRAREYANPKSKLADPMPRAKARVRMWAEFGTALVGRGYDRKTVKTMIERALDAAGL